MTSGPLEGALLNLRDGRVATAGRSHQAAYELPTGIAIEDGDLAFEIVWAFMI